MDLSINSNFVNWLKKSGAFISSKIGIKDYSSEGSRLGIVALDDIKKDEILFKIPRTCLLSRSSTKFRDQIRKHCKRIGWIPLMWSIILEKLSGSDSFWSPYFNILPDTIYLPSVWNDKDLESLEGTGIESLVTDSSDQFKKYFLPLKSVFPLTSQLSDSEFEKLFHYAGCLISAYSFCEDPEKELDIAMVPLADTLNHKTGFNNARLYYDIDGLNMICHADCRAGDQLFNTYGDLGNRDLLLKYGFTDDPNPFHAVVFDPTEWLRNHVKFSKIGASNGKRIADSYTSSSSLFIRYYGVIPCELRGADGDDSAGLKSFLDWIYLLSLPAKTSTGALKPKTNYDSFLGDSENRAGILNILKARRALLKEEDNDNYPFGPQKFVQIIKKQDISILDGYISFLSK